MGEFRHPETSRLASFLIDDDPLTPDEHEHLLRCRECTNRMVSSAMAELAKRQAAAEQKESA